MRLKWYGTATILLEHDGTQILFDPFLPLNGKLYKPDTDDLSSASSILVTHGHLDHITGIPSIMEHGSNRPVVYCTATPRNILISKGVQEEQITVIKPGDLLSIEPFEVRVLKGKHIIFDIGLVMKTIFRFCNLKHRKNLSYMLKENKACTEVGETVIYDISIPGKRVLLMGSLNLDDDTDYPKGADLLLLPFQGRTDIVRYAISIVDHLQPRKILLTHYDDSFPPISSSVKTEPFVSLMKKNYPGTPVICVTAGSEWLII